MTVKIDGTLGIDKIKDGSVTSSDLIDSINLPGSPTVATATPGTKNNQLATTAYVDGKMVLGTSVATTSGTSIDFTGIPSWVKRVTIMFNGLSTNGTSYKIVQIGSGSVVTSGYTATNSYITNTNVCGAWNPATGFSFGDNGTSNNISGQITIILLSGNTYISSNVFGWANAESSVGGGSVTVNGIIDRVRITTVNGTDAFDAGSINIMYEG
jgi:hypothetical protein